MCAIVRETSWSAGPPAAHLVLLRMGFARRGAQVRNAALGFNQALSYALCVDEFYGADADWVHWEMGALAGAQDDGAEVHVWPSA